MDAPAEPTQVMVGPGLSVAAQAAAQVAEKINSETDSDIPDLKPVDVVDESFLESLGIRTRGWRRAGKTFWKEHSTQFIAAAASLQTFLLAVQGDIPAQWERIGRAVGITLVVLAFIAKLRIQPAVQVEQVKTEVERNTP